MNLFIQIFNQLYSSNFILNNIKFLHHMFLKEICPRGNNKVVILYFLIHDKGLLFMLDRKLKYMCEYINKYRVPSMPLLD